MLVAVDHNNNRIKPFKGGIGFCQLCKNEVRAYCGEININHWRHINLNLCDTWKESESEWHREWKNEFPQEWQEVLIENQNEKHIADIKTPNGLVLELQNSSISSTTIKIREQFYNNIVWLINANNFKENFKITSIVNSRLRQIDSEYNQMINYTPDRESDKIIKTKNKLRNVEYEIQKCNWSYTSAIKKLNEIEDFEKDIAKKTNEYVNSNSYYSSVLSDFESNCKTTRNQLVEKINICKEDIVKNEEIIHRINSFKDCEVNGYKDYKEVSSNQISSGFYQKCIMIEIESEDSLFPNILTFKSEEEYKHVSRNPKYRLYVNLNDKISHTITQIEKSKNEITNSENDINQLITATIEEIKLYLKKTKEILKKEITVINSNLDLYHHKVIDLKSKIEYLKDSEVAEKEKMFTAIVKQHKSERFETMNAFKGLYNYYWKHRRKSWDFSERKIYLDFENAIFEILNENTLRKMDKLSFIELIKNLKT